jgi:hypothetical protein
LVCSKYWCPISVTVATISGTFKMCMTLSAPSKSPFCGPEQRLVECNLAPCLVNQAKREKQAESK